ALRRRVRHARDRVIPRRGAARARPAVGRRARGRVSRLRLRRPLEDNGCRFRQETAMANAREVVIVSGARTAIGDYGGSLKDIPPTELGARVVREAIARSKVDAARIGQCVFGNVIHTEQKDMYLSRVVAINGGLPHESGARMNDTKVVDMMVGALTDPFDTVHMGITAENVATKCGITREQQDAFAVESHRRATKAH